MPRCLIALGSNLGDRARTLTRATELLRAQSQIKSLVPSHFHETPPIGGAPSQNSFLNAAASLDTTLSPQALHAALKQVEATLGRQRNERWAARTIDLDLLLYDDLVLETPELAIPHPRMAFRRFVLEPAVEVAAEMVHPTIGWTLAQLLAHLNSAPPYFALLGMPGSEKTTLALSLASAFGGRLLLDPAGPDSPNQPDPPSHTFERQIQFLDRRFSLLDRRSWQPGLAVSDFYFDQCLAYARLELAAADFGAYRKAWQQAHEGVISPKLLVVLDVRSDRSNLAVQGAEDFYLENTSGVGRLRDELTRLANRRGVGPVLYAGADPESQFSEVAAAIEAMQ